jgi:hypothetical protein
MPVRDAEHSAGAARGGRLTSTSHAAGREYGAAAATRLLLLAERQPDGPLQHHREATVRGEPVVRRGRHEKSLSQEVPADLAGLSARYLGSIECATGSASVTVLGRHAQALHVDACELIRTSASARRVAGNDSGRYRLTARFSVVGFASRRFDSVGVFRSH